MEHRDDDDDDDVSFAKWMSSFWGHSWMEEAERGPRDRHGSRDTSSRKASLPCPFPVLPRVTASDSHPRRHSHEDQGFRCHTHMRDYRKYSGDGSFKDPLESRRRSHSKIQAFSESFEQQLCFRTKRSVSLGPASRKDRNGRETPLRETRSRREAEEARSSPREEHGEARRAPPLEEGPKGYFVSTRQGGAAAANELQLGVAAAAEIRAPRGKPDEAHLDSCAEELCSPSAGPTSAEHVPHVLSF
ncbi:PREDICTED: leukemia NUP98 fusion partner 1 [Miniopterus natalensis]|uniref:leukemia NUP98 fusion partner 1 n=1 Tax=Miniopterus natalensis TaxID=291302 RepID=UPI0007A6E357|nr:PREDICTED: leukemia NUP98 fusion partner 1 [Miniopterus natalensis]